MSSAQHHIYHKVIPLVCQALLASPGNITVWVEGLRLLSSHKLRATMSLTSSIWLPLLLQGLNSSQPLDIIIASLELACPVANILEPIKVCLIKPLKRLKEIPRVAETEQMAQLVFKLGLSLNNELEKEEPKQTLSTNGSASNTPMVNSAPGEHPFLSDLLSHCLPLQVRTVEQAWEKTLLIPPQQALTTWVENLATATIQASGVNELKIVSRLDLSIYDGLFQTAFMHCYKTLPLDSDFKSRVDHTMASLLECGFLRIVKIILDLLAFLGKAGTKLPETLQEAARRCATTQFTGTLNQPIPAIVLWHTEQQCLNEMSSANLINLVEANIRLGSIGYDSAWSSLLCLEADHQIKPQPQWITHLCHWQEALDAQDELDKEGSENTFSSINTRMISYHALGQFKQGYELAQLHFEGFDDHERRIAAHWATAAAWHMGDYETMADWLAFHPKGTSKSLYKAIIDIHSKQYASAFHHINKAQTLSYDEVQSLLGSGQQGAFKSLAKTELLVELQEAIQYISQPEAQPHILETWKLRFKRSHPDANSWLKRLQVWSLACPPSKIELQDCYLDCAKLCESIGMHEAARRILTSCTPKQRVPGCKVAYTWLRFEWKEALLANDEAKLLNILNKLESHISEMLAHMQINRDILEGEGLGLQPLQTVSGHTNAECRSLARRYHRLAQWSEVLQGTPWMTDTDSQVYRYYNLCAKLDPEWFAASYELAQSAMKIYNSDPTDENAVGNYVVPAIRALFQAVRTKDSSERKIRALLRLVTLWFRFGEHSLVLHEVDEQLSQTPIDAWLLAIPQLIARLGTRHQDLQGVLVGLLKEIAFRFPHAVIWPLLTASHTRKSKHQSAAKAIMDHICSMPDGLRLVSQAELVGHELIRTSTSWLERWKSMLEAVLPHHEVLETQWERVPELWEEDMAALQRPETPYEEQFVEMFGKRLHHIQQTLIKYQATHQLSLANTAYIDIFNLYRDIDNQLNRWRVPGAKLDLESVAPKLLLLRNCILTVPGKYDHNMKLDDQAFINGFEPAVGILASKQMPRKLVIQSFEKDFTFLLKGHEDLRGDERIMQLFTLVNTLLNHNSESFNRNLYLLPYEVIPLSPEAGLVSWVAHTTTLQSMIQRHREKTGRTELSAKEDAALLGMEMDKSDKLPVEVRVKRLEKALSLSNQEELRDILWEQSPSPEVWIKRRTNFARTVGVASMIGHIIGLGDRHGSNILIHQLTWGVVHIDFGDLFGVTMERKYLPEKVPFRLTRMMTNAFELASSCGHCVPGTRGNFKQAATLTMEVVRDNRSTLLAMLEAFLYDPLLSWMNPPDGANSLETTLGIHSSTKTEIVLSEQSPRPENQSSSKDGFETENYLARLEEMGSTNSKALHVLAEIDRKLAGYHGDAQRPLPIKDQVQKLVEEATNIENLAQGYVLGWKPHW